MADKKILGTYQSEHEVLDKIDELRVQGFSEKDMYIVTSDMESLSMVRGRTDVDLRPSEGNWMNRFMAFLSGDEPVKAAFTNMGFTEEESARYYNEVKRGAILLYVDRDYQHIVDNPDSKIVNEHLDANVGSNVTVDYSDNTTNVYDNIDTTIEQEDRLHMQEERLVGGNDRTQADEVSFGKPIVKEQQIMEVPVSFDEVNMERHAVQKESDTGEVFSDGEEIPTPETERERLMVKSLIDRDRLQ